MRQASQAPQLLPLATDRCARMERKGEERKGGPDRDIDVTTTT
jgi:hypothetical protein